MDIDGFGMLPAGRAGVHSLAVTSLLVSVASALVIALHATWKPQRMAVMNIVWPLTGLYAGPLALMGYFTIGAYGRRDRPKTDPPLWKAAITGSLHCGSGCTVGDIIGEFGVYFLGLLIAGQIIWGYLLYDFILAFLFGIVFQYYSIVPMRHLSFRKGVIAAVKADTLSIAAFQTGMYGWMLLARFVLVGRDIPPTDPEHWLSMQVAMLIGLATTYPMNLFLIHAGLKEKM